MKRILVLLTMTSSLLIAGCGTGSKDSRGGLTDLKKQLDEKKKEQSSLEAEVRSLEEKISKLDTTAAEEQKQKTGCGERRVFKRFCSLYRIAGKD